MNTTTTSNGTRLSSFTFVPGLELRSVEINGSPWFLASDIGAALGVQSVGQSVEHVRPDDKRMQYIGLRGKAPWLVNESGLYDLILGSRKPNVLAPM